MGRFPLSSRFLSRPIESLRYGGLQSQEPTSPSSDLIQNPSFFTPTWLLSHVGGGGVMHLLLVGQTKSCRE